jgi:hypothetical protein
MRGLHPSVENIRLAFRHLISVLLLKFFPEFGDVLSSDNPEENVDGERDREQEDEDDGKYEPKGFVGCL